MPPTLALAQRGVPGGVCVTPACQELSKTLLSYVNMNADPCSDFFQYTCGSWLNSEAVKQQDTSYTTLVQMEINGLDKIVKFLNGSFEDLSNTIKTDDASYHTQDQIDVDKKNFQLAKDYYESCLDIDTITALGATPIFPLVAAIENDLLPYTDALDSKDLAEAIAALTLQEIDTLFKASIAKNPHDHDYNIFYLIEPNLGTAVTYSDIESLKSYQTRLTQILSSVLGGPSDNSAYQQLVIEESRKSNFTLWSASKITRAVSNFIDFEVQLSNIHVVHLEDEPTPNPLPTLKELQRISNSTIDWTAFLTTLVSADYATPELPIYYDQIYLEKLLELLKFTPVATLQEYFVIRAVKGKLAGLKFPEGVNPYPTASLASSSFIVEKSSFFRAPSSRDPTSFTSEQICAMDTSQRLKNIVGRYFALETFGASKEKKQAEDFVDNIHSTWLQILPKTSWVDDETKAKSIQKIEVLQKKVAYSTVSPDWREPTSIEAYYKGLTIGKTSYYDAIFAATAFKNNKKWKALQYKRDKNEWAEDDYPQQVHAQYDPSLNEIEIPVGIMQEPYYSLKYPGYMNYGALGSIIGHELTHALDSSGRFYNAQGYNDDWFSKSASETYTKKSQCFIDQFNNFTLTGPGGVQLPLDGKNVLGENIADSGGLHIAYDAYKNYIKKIGAPELTVPKFEKVTPEQLFFINHGIFTCATVSKQTAQNDIDTDVHAPWYYRNIGALLNSEEFSKAFNCPVGSPMNPKNKCSIW